LRQTRLRERLSLRRRLLELSRLVRRRPVAATIVPRPRRRRRGTPPLRLSHALVASDLNPRYLDCWPLVRLAWQQIAGLEAVLVLIAHECDVPPELRADPGVAVFPPIDGLHTAFQAQCIRLLYPALLQVDGAVLTSDVDIVPLNRTYFHAPIGHLAPEHFLAYRNALAATGELPICYNAALPRTWGEIFAVGALEEIRTRLLEWGAGLRYDGVRGGHGWDTDQIELYRTVVERGRRRRDVWILDDRFTGHRRFIPPPPDGDGLPHRLTRAIERGFYSDFHLLHPFAEHRALNEHVVTVACAPRP
jgi:hypothetical protein